MLDSFGPHNIDLGSPVSDHPLNYGLVSWWMGLPNNSGGGTLFDLVQTGRNNGTLTNGPTWVPGQSGFGAVSFDGGDDYVSYGVSMLPTAITVSVWFKAAADANTFILGNQHSSNNNYGWSLRTRTTGLMWLQQNSNVDPVVTGSYSAGVWSHLAFTASGSASALYQDGVAVGAGSWTTFNNGDSFRIGVFPDTGSNYYGGLLDDIRIYSRALTSSEIYSLYEQHLRGHPDTLRRVSSRVWSFGSDGGGTPATTGGYLLLLGVG